MAEGPHTGTPIQRKDRKGSYVIGEKIGEGGEGEVYAVADSLQWVIKVYKPGKAPKSIAAKKLFVMEELRPRLAGERAGHPSLTWPEQIIQDRSSNSLVGFVMPWVDMAGTMTVGEFFAPSVRQRKLQAMNRLLVLQRRLDVLLRESFVTQVLLRHLYDVHLRREWASGKRPIVNASL